MLISFYGEYVNIRLDILEMVPDNHRNSSVPQMSGCGTKTLSKNRTISRINLPDLAS